MSFFFIVLFLGLAVYFAPGIALFPRLLHKPHTLILIPLVSVGIVYSVVTLLQTLGLFVTDVVRPLVYLGLGAAVFQLSRKPKVEISAQQCQLLLFNLLICLPYFIKMDTSAFDSADEIYSWNFWALQHAFQETISFAHTGAPYPQLFPKWIAFQYVLMNNVELQLPIKALFVLFPLTMLNCLALCIPKHDNAAHQRGHILAYGLLSLCLVFGLNWQKYFDYGYADPLMATFLVASIALYMRDTKNPPWGWVSVFAVLAALTKQAALVWSAFAWPVIALMHYRQHRNKAPLTAALITLGILALWWWFEGRGFTDNGGVVAASQAGRAWWVQLGFAFKTYFIYQPHIALWFIAAAYLSYQHKRFGALWALLIVPATLAWFMYGAYQLRLGIHILAVLGLVLVTLFPYQKLQMPQPLRAKTQHMAWVCLVIISLVGCGFSYQRSLLGQHTLNPLQASTISFKKYFGAESEWVLNNLYSQSDKLLFVPANYIAGLFYRHAPMVAPAYKPHYDLEDLLAEWDTHQPDYVFSTGRLAQGNPASALIEEAARTYPGLLVPMTSADNRYGYQVYRLNKSELLLRRF